MTKRYRALGTLSGLFKVVAWILLVLGILSAILVAAYGAIQSTRGVSGVLADVPLANQVSGLLGGLLAAAGMLVGTLLLFLWVMAVAEGIQVAMAIERNTRETALYLKGESQIPPPPAGTMWQSEDAIK